MADLSKIKLNGTTYDFKDSYARNNMVVQGDLTTLAENFREEFADVAFSGDYTDLENTPTIPTNISSFNNDAGYLTSYTETDPTVPSWAKQSTKPTYTASEVGALPDTTTIPTKTSDLTNDSGFITSYTETDPTVPAWAKAANKPTYTAAEIGALPDTYTAPVTSVNGDTGAIIVDKVKTTAASANTEYNLVGTVTTNNNTAAVTEYKQDLLSFAKTADLSRLTIGSTATPGTIRLYTSASGANGYTDIKSNTSSTNTRTITLPDASGTVALTNDIPNVPSWALATNKPTYTASEVGATTSSDVSGMISSALEDLTGFNTEIVQTLPATGVAGTFYFVTGDNNNQNDIYEEYLWINNGWEKLGNFDATNIDLSGYLQTTDIAAWAKAANKPSYTANEVGALPSNTNYVSSFNGESGAITYVPPVSSVNGQTGVVELNIPADTSDLTNGAGFLTSFTETDPTVPSWAKASTKPSYTYSEVGAAASDHVHGNIRNDGSISVNTSLANGDRLVFSDTSDSYKLKNTSITIGTSTAQYLANNGTWQNVPTTLPASDVSDWAKASTKPSYTYSEVGAAASSHAHGNITNAGDITATAAIASGDRLVINDESASKIINSTITFGSSTSQFLANNGTWQDLNNSDLATRVAALENLEWATYYSGRSNPSNSQGQNGDIYLQY